MIKLNIKGKPLSINKTYAKTKFSFYMTKEGKEYKESVIRQAKQQYKGEPLGGKLKVVYIYYFPDMRVRDHLNLNKCLNDGLNGIVWVDDKQITESHHYEMFDKNNPRIELTIYEKTI